MAISFQDSYIKAQQISGDTTNPGATLTQFKQDINIGYHRFDAAIARYFTRKQQFANIVASQQFYQTPVDAIRVMEVSQTITSNYEVPLTQIRGEHEWRLKNMFTYTTNVPTHYFIYGSNQIGIWPKPSTAVTNGLRFVYQPQDVDMTKDDYTTGTVTITGGSASVTGTSTVWTSATHKGMSLSVTDGSDGNWYEVDTVTNNTSLTLLTPYAGPSVTAVAYKLGQIFNFPSEYDDVPVDYALSRYFEKKNNPSRAEYHLNKYKEAVTDALKKYASSSLSNVITDDEDTQIISNPWLWPPMAG